MVKEFIQAFARKYSITFSCYAEKNYTIQWNADITNLYIMKSVV